MRAALTFGRPIASARVHPARHLFETFVQLAGWSGRRRAHIRELIRQTAQRNASAIAFSHFALWAVE
jgi:hypothetical protein